MGTESFRQVSLRFATRRYSPPFYLINSCQEISEAARATRFRDTTELLAFPPLLCRDIALRC